MLACQVLGQNRRVAAAHDDLLLARAIRTVDSNWQSINLSYEEAAYYGVDDILC